MAAHMGTARKYSAMETLLEPSWKDLKKENKMYGVYTKRRKAWRYGVGGGLSVLDTGLCHQFHWNATHWVPFSDSSQCL